MCVRLSGATNEKYGTFENVGCEAPDKWHYLPVCLKARAQNIDNCIGSEMRMKNSVGALCPMKFLGSREGFHRFCLFDESSSEYAPLIG